MATVSKPTYYKVAGALMLLLVLTVAASQLAVGPALHVVLALSIAFAKAVLIVLFFMHVRYGSRLTMVFAAAGFFWLVILFLLTFSDYLARG
jgi:cytochrome c oxidase subunit 4